ncbi:MAG: hypothetical protein J6Y54_02880 [Lentisphaeria bacterium]|nr:hypothetical protein [Lentisphaeria bacterium]
MKRLSSILAAALLTITGYAAEQSDFAKAQAELKSRAPEDYAKIEKLAAADLNAAMREFRAAAKKHGIKLPRPQLQRSRRPGAEGERMGRGGERQGRERGRGINPLTQLVIDGKIRKAFPQEFDAVNREFCAVEEKLEKLAERAGVQYPQSFHSQLHKLRAAAPEKMAEIERLAAEDPRGAFRALNELAGEQGIDIAARGMRGGRRGGDRPGRGPRREEEPPPEPRRISTPPIRKLREAFPEEMKRYDELRQEDPAAAKKMLLELNERLRQRQTEK